MKTVASGEETAFAPPDADREGRYRMESVSDLLRRRFSAGELGEMQEMSSVRTAAYRKNEIIFHTGDTAREFGLVAEGSVYIETVDFWGNRSILGHVPAGQIFAETYVICREPLRVDAVAAEDAVIRFVDLSRLTDSANAGRGWYAGMMSVLLEITARKNLSLSDRIFFTSPKTVRERLLAYLSAQAGRSGSSTVRIPFDRQQLADYLNLDRTAVSKELGKMKREGLIEYRKNQFTLLYPRE